MSVKNIHQQAANPATNIGYDWESAPIVCLRDFGRVMLADQAHRFVENSASFRIAPIILPETTSEYLIESRVASFDTGAQA
jgi:hypothetical protein